MVWGSISKKETSEKLPVSLKTNERHPSQNTNTWNQTTAKEKITEDMRVLEASAHDAFCKF
jgi:hypothetical protein